MDVLQKIILEMTDILRQFSVGYFIQISITGNAGLCNESL